MKGQRFKSSNVRHVVHHFNSLKILRLIDKYLAVLKWGGRNSETNFTFAEPPVTFLPTVALKH